jgi:hypothetical protein
VSTVYFNLAGDDLEAVDFLAEQECDGNRSEILRRAVHEYLHCDNEAPSAVLRERDEAREVVTEILDLFERDGYPDSLTGISVGRAAYEAFQRAFPSEDWGPWESLEDFPAGDPCIPVCAGWEAVARAAVEAAELTHDADLRAERDELRACLSSLLDRTEGSRVLTDDETAEYRAVASASGPTPSGDDPVERLLALPLPENPSGASTSTPCRPPTLSSSPRLNG